VAKDGRGVYNGGTGLVNLIVVERNRGMRENGGEGVGLGRSKVGLLEAKYVSRRKKVANARGGLRR